MGCLQAHSGDRSHSIVKNFEDGILAYVQPESIAWCINRLLADPKEMEKIAKAGCDRIEAEFSWDRIAKRTEEVYEKILDSNLGPVAPDRKIYKNGDHKGPIVPR